MVTVEVFIYVDEVINITQNVVNNFETSVVSDGGIFESKACLVNELNSLGGYFETQKVAKRIELFNDEKISVTSSLQNANDLGKIYTDYSQSFTIPASDYNNKIFSHWYESDVNNGYDHRIRYDAFIELDTITFKKGNIQLEKVNKKNDAIESYSITFYGNLTQLKDVLKDTKMNALDWSIYNHPYNSTQIKNRITQSPFYYFVGYPLIGSQRKFYYKNGIAAEDVTLTTAPIKWNELFPAISLERVLGRIENYFGLTFQGTFLTMQQFTELNLYLKNAETLKVQTEKFTLKPDSNTGSFPELNLTTGKITTNWNFASGTTYSTKIKIQLTVTPADLTIPYSVFIYKNGLLFSTFTNLMGVNGSAGTAFSIDLFNKQDEPQNNVYEVKISSDASNSFKSKFWYWRYNNNAIHSFATSVTLAAQFTVSNINIANYVPDITVEAFLTGLIKAFNLMIIPIADKTFEFVPLEMYYNQGKILDITKYVQSNEFDIERPKLFKAINFQYEKSTNILNNAFYGNNNTEYGDLVYKDINSNESSNYDIKLPFENVLFEKTFGENFLTASLIDKDLKPYVPKTMLIYNNGVNDLSTPIVLTTETGTTTFSSYQRYSNEYTNIPTDTSQLMSMNFGNEQSPWYNVLAPRGLYYRMYSNYVQNLYNIKTRILKVKAILPQRLLGSTVTNYYGEKTGINLNDRLIIRDKRYIINNFTTDLTTGEATFELITDYRGINAASTVGYRYADSMDIDIDNTNQDFKVTIYKNDYDYFGIKGAESFLNYTPTLNNYDDYILDVNVPDNTSGLDRTDRIGIDYYKKGIFQVTEYIYINQRL